MQQEKPAYKRILLKLSGEALMGDDQFGINRDTIVRMVDEIAEVTRLGVELAVVIGGGNIFRGVAGGSVGMDRATADYMGMLATVMNALALGDTMNKAGLTARVMSAIGIEQVVEPYVRPKALQYLEEGKVVIFAAGTGNPFFTTDTAAALRGAEIGAEIVLKATKVDGVYTAGHCQAEATRPTSASQSRCQTGSISGSSDTANGQFGFQSHELVGRLCWFFHGESRLTKARH